MILFTFFDYVLYYTNVLYYEKTHETNHLRNCCGGAAKCYRHRRPYTMAQQGRFLSFQKKQPWDIHVFLGVKRIKDYLSAPARPIKYHMQHPTQ